MAVPMKPSAHSHKSSLFTKLGTLVIGKGLARGEKGEWPAGMLRTPTNWEAQAALISLSLSLTLGCFPGFFCDGPPPICYPASSLSNKSDLSWVFLQATT